MKEAWKTEGPTDVLAMLSKNPDAIVVCNANGASEKPGWMAEAFADCDVVNVVHDCDRPGQEGAARWVLGISKHVKTVRNVILPYPIVENHGKDLRDYFNDGHTFADLEALAQSSETADSMEVEVQEKPEDPTRLARVNIEQYRHESGGVLRFWRDEFWKWTGTRYKAIKTNDFNAKIWGSVRQEMIRIHKQSIGTKDEKPVYIVTGSLIYNVIKATASLTLLSADMNESSWIDDRETRNWVSLENGILDIEAVLRDDENALRPHDPRWFCLTARPYAFDPDAGCPLWEKYLMDVMEGDLERIQLLQEWAGYLLLNDTAFAKFLIMEGDGANGKSVYCAGIRAMLGADSCSHVPLELFGDRFSKTLTIGKLVNICTDVGEIDKICEGLLKGYTSGDKQFFDRKGIAGLDMVPSARLMIGTNNRPRFCDKSGGIWRRILIVPFNHTVDSKQRVRRMDKDAWWAEHGQLPGMFNWAIAGLHRIRQNDEFTVPQICLDELADYRNENNPAREFLQDHYQENHMSSVSTTDIYEHYRVWCRDNGYREMSSRSLGKEVNRVFPETKKRRLGNRNERFHVYQGIIKLENDRF